MFTLHSHSVYIYFDLVVVFINGKTWKWGAAHVILTLSLLFTTV